MAEIINLRAVKKARSKTMARAQADANAAKFGRTKAERTLDHARETKAQATLDAHKRASETDADGSTDGGPAK